MYLNYIQLLYIKLLFHHKWKTSCKNTMYTPGFAFLYISPTQSWPRTAVYNGERYSYKAGCWWSVMALLNHSSESPRGFYTMVQGSNSKEIMQRGHFWSSVKAWSRCSPRGPPPLCWLSLWVACLTTVGLIKVMLTCSMWWPGEMNDPQEDFEASFRKRVLAQILWLWPNACQRWVMILGRDGDLVIVYWSLKEIFIFFLAAVHMKVKTYGQLLSSAPGAGRDSMTCSRTPYLVGCLLLNRLNL